MVMCMNDPGPILDTRQTIIPAGATTPIANPTLGQLVTDPAFTQGYSQFCYEIPFMPAATAYLDTPVVPTSAFAGAGYNNVDCAYPTLTPAIKEVDGDAVGPWVSAAGNTLTITALGDQAVPNNAYNGPSATTAPYNQKTVMRHYGFGTSQGTVTIGGVSVPSTSISSWTDGKIVLAVPSGVPNCPVQQQAAYGGSTAQCGELVITTAPPPGGTKGQQSIDTVTVTIGGKAPTHIAASASIQAAIDAAQPGDLLMVDPTCTTAGVTGACTTGAVAGTTYHTAAHSELLLMWKPVRLQGVGAASSIINANTHPAGKMDAWRRQVNCLFGLSIDGYPMSTANPTYDTTGAYSCPGTNGNTWTAFSGSTAIPNSADGSRDPQVDRIPLEAVIGWDASQNGNMAELLQEPSLMGALEGAGITVLSKGVQFPAGAVNVFGATPNQPNATAAVMPTGTLLLTQQDCAAPAPAGSSYPTLHPSNFLCNPSTIDGIGITNSSQGGGGIFVHAWGHELQIANNRIYNNSGTLSGGINLGQGEFPGAYIAGAGALNAAPGSCDQNTLGANALIPVTVATNAQEPYCHNLFVHMHHNAVMLSSSTGDELFSATPAGAGGASFCTGSDYYKFDYNWVCGNLSSGDGGGLGHMGYSWNGDIEHNTVIFNQSLNPTIPANGGGMIIMGTPDADPACSASNDQDCVPTPIGSITPSDGVGPNLVINANLIMGNAAEAGSGGGIAFQNVNGSDVLAFPGNSAMWHHISVTNNIIADNVAGWDGGGVSMLDALYLDLVNNTIVANNTTATAGTLVNTLGAPLASTQNTSNNCYNSTTSVSNCGTSSRPQVAGVVALQNSAVLSANITQLPSTTPVVCPPGHYTGASATSGTCVAYSYPLLANNILWQNASFQVGVGALSAQYQQAIVTIYNSTFTGALGASVGTAIGTQTATGQCVSGSSYWDLGVRGDTGPNDHTGGVTLNPTYSVITSTSGYPSHNIATAPGFTQQYCDGARQPPESGASGWNVPVGIADATVPNPIYNLTPVATVDEGNNWINLRWGPLTMVNPTTGALLGNYSYPPGNGPNNVPTSQLSVSQYIATDFFGNPRPETFTNGDAFFDAGAVEGGSAPASFGGGVTGGPLTFSNVPGGTTSAPQTLTLHNTGTVPLTNIAVNVTAPFSRPTGTAGGTCSGQLAANSAGTTTCTINIVYTAPACTPVAPATTCPSNGTATVTANQGAITGSPVALNGAAIAAPLTPAVRAYGTVARGSTTGPTQVFTLTNTGNVTMTGIQDATLGGTNPTEFFIVQQMTTCGPTQPGRVAGSTGAVVSLAPGASCAVAVQFRPLSAQTTGSKSATLSIVDSFGTQSTTANGLTGNANP
jgi:hypothetical protein